MQQGSEEKEDKRVGRVSVGSFSGRRDAGDWSLCIGGSMTRKWRPRFQPRLELCGGTSINWSVGLRFLASFETLKYGGTFQN